jgi:hypothetical protein
MKYPEKLTNYDDVVAMFGQSGCSLATWAASPDELIYLQAIDSIRDRTGAPNILLAHYILMLESKINDLESRLSQLEQNRL